eukprot:15353234-Alexandrium_andersonii.AAC.1
MAWRGIPCLRVGALRTDRRKSRLRNAITKHMSLHFGRPLRANSYGLKPLPADLSAFMQLQAF